MAWTRGRLKDMSTDALGCQPTTPRCASGGRSLSLLTQGLCRPWGGAEHYTCSFEKDALPCAAPESVREVKHAPGAQTALLHLEAPPFPQKGPVHGTARVISGHRRGAVVKYLPASAEDARDIGSIPRWGRSPGEGNNSPLQYSCLENPTIRGAWQATVHGVAELDTTEQLSTRSKKIIKIFENGKHSFPQKPPEHFMGEDRDQDSWLQLGK